MEIVLKLDRLKLPNAADSPAKNVFQQISKETGAAVTWKSGSKQKQPKEDASLSPAEKILQKITKETGPVVKWKSGLKEKPAKQEPCIKISGTEENVKKARDMLIEKMEVQGNRVQMKLEVTYLEHPSLIGKKGSLINKVMETTECQIHFPDVNACKCHNKNSRCQMHCSDVNRSLEKINQVSIYGDPVNAERARVMIRALLPIQIHFDVPNPNQECYIPETKFLGSFNGLHLYSASRQTTNCFIIRCNQDQFSHLRKDITLLMEHICCINGANLPPVYMVLDIMQKHHNFVKGPNNSNIEGIVKRTGAKITFPDKNSPKSEERSITISGSLDSVYVAWLEIMNSLPVHVSFDVNITREIDGEYKDFLRDLGISVCSYPNDKNFIQNVILKGPEKFAKQMLQCRQRLLHLPSLEFRTDTEVIDLAYDFLLSLNDNFQSSPANTIPTSVKNITNRNMGHETIQQLTQSINSAFSHKQLLAITNNSVPPVISNRSINIDNNQFVETGHYYIATTKDYKIQARPVLFAVEQSSRTSGTRQTTQNENGYYWESKLREDSFSKEQLLTNNNNWIKNIPCEKVSSGFSEMTHRQSLTEQSAKHSRLPQTLPMEDQNGETTLAEDYYRKQVLAARAMRRPIESTQVPTSLWAGYGFSKSMPAVKHYNQFQFSESTSEDLEKSWENVMKNLDIWANEKESKLAQSNYFDFLSMHLHFDANKQTKDILPELLWKHGLHQHIETFTKQEIDFQAFLGLTERDLFNLGIAQQARVKLICLIKELKKTTIKGKTFDAAPGAERKSSQDRLDKLQIY